MDWHAFAARSDCNCTVKQLTFTSRQPHLIVQCFYAKTRHCTTTARIRKLTMTSMSLMWKNPFDNPDPAPIYFLAVLAVLLCAYFAWLGYVALRLYFHKGALTPEYERFLILPAHLRNRSPQYGHNRRVTAFPIPAPPKSPACELSRFPRVPRVDITDVDANKLHTPSIRAFIVERQRISRLPAFVQDDCGDGSAFPDVPVATAPVEMKQSALALPDLNRTPSAKYKSVGLTKLDQREWLVINHTYRDLHLARDFLLTKNNTECVQAKRDGEAACEELLQLIVESLISKYPESFSIKTINRQKHVRNEITKEEWSLVQPFNCHPLEVCARLAMEDFNILLKGEFTQQYYL